MPTKVDMSEFLAGLRKASKAQQELAARALDIFAEQVIGDAQQLCPVKTGFLQGSGTTGEPAKVTSRKIEKLIGFNASYAAAVHERLISSRGNPIRHAVGQAKFLSAAMENLKPKLIPFIAGRMAAGSAGGAGGARGAASPGAAGGTRPANKNEGGKT